MTLISANFQETLPSVGNASDATLNAALFTGTVPSDASDGAFDGGFFNALRLIEDWYAQTLTFRGAIATPFVSRYANEPWRAGAPAFYVPPTARVFAYETSFQDWTGLPKGTPTLYALIRGECEMLPPSDMP